MSMTNKPINDQELQAYVDGELDSLRLAEIEFELEQNPQLAAEAADYRSYNEALHRLFDPVLDEKIPEQLIPAVKPKITQALLTRVASIALAIGLGLVLGWLSRGEVMPLLSAQHEEDDIAVVDAFAYHAVYTPEVRHPVEVTADQQHLMGWLSKRLNTKVQAPSLDALGFELLGGRLLTTENLPAAQFMYQNAGGKRMTLFLRQRKSEEAISAFEFESQGSQNAFYWIDNKLCFVLVATMPKDELLKAAHVVYEELNS